MCPAAIEPPAHFQRRHVDKPDAPIEEEHVRCWAVIVHMGLRRHIVLRSSSPLRAWPERATGSTPNGMDLVAPTSPRLGRRSGWRLMSLPLAQCGLHESSSRDLHMFSGRKYGDPSPLRARAVGAGARRWMAGDPASRGMCSAGRLSSSDAGVRACFALLRFASPIDRLPSAQLQAVALPPQQN